MKKGTGTANEMAVAGALFVRFEFCVTDKQKEVMDEVVRLDTGD